MTAWGSPMPCRRSIAAGPSCCTASGCAVIGDDQVDPFPRRRIDARVLLRSALDDFEQLGVTPWVERARAELRASGETARRRDPSTRDQLTPQELHIAGLAAGGLTNPEIGAQLFLSPRTIDYHLRKVFAKLGIASRAELAGVDLGERVAA